VKIFALIAFGVIVLSPQGAEAQRVAEVRITGDQALVSLLKGAAQVSKQGKTATSLREKDLLQNGDEVSVGDEAKVEIMLPDRSFARFSDGSRFKILQISGPDAGDRSQVNINVALGRSWANVSKAAGKTNFRLTADNAVAGVRGTIFRMNVNEDKSLMVRVYDGIVQVSGGITPLEPPKVVGPPGRIAGPKPVAGPKKVTMEEWTYLIKANQQITIRADGVPEKPETFDEKEDLDPWVIWNRERDALIK